MRGHILFSLTLACLSIQVLTVASLVALRWRSSDLRFAGYLYQQKRQPSTPSDQIEVLPNLSAPGERTENVSIAGNGNDTAPKPGVITHGAPAVASNEVDCNDITTGRDNKCWAQLNLTKWVQEWLANNNCHIDEPFASCFLRIEGFPGLDCTGIKISACTAPQGDSILKDPQVFYVAYNIYAINQFFFSWWTAVGNAASMASDNVASIVQLLDPLSSANAILDDVLITLTSFFALVPELSYLTEGIEAFTGGWLAVAQVWENALFMVPQIGRFVFPTDSVTSQVIQIAALSNDMVHIIQTVQDNLNRTVVSVMTNATEFLAFASQGNFSASPPSLADQTNYLLYAFNTYVISKALTGNSVYGVFGQGTDPHELATNGSKTPYDLSDCKRGYNNQGVCDTWWYSERYSSAFGLDDFSHMNRQYGDILTILFSNFTTGELLFEGAYACNTGGNYSQPMTSMVNAGGVKTSCFSQLRVLAWDMSCVNPTKHNGCEFVEFPPQNNFLGNCGSHSAYEVMDQPTYCVPASYLGPLIAQNHIQLKR